MDPTIAMTDYSDKFSPATLCQMKEDEDFKNELGRRPMAASAFVKVDASAKIRRALPRRDAALKRDLATGQRGYCCREGKTNKLIKNKRKGPAIAIFKEMRQDESGPRIYWIARGANLQQCAPEHVRPDVCDQGCVLLENLAQAKGALGGARRARVAQFYDVSSQQQPFDAPGDSDADIGDDDGPGDEPPPKRDRDEDAKRILKTKWGLKWTKSDVGTPRAKARSALHGSNDPDAADGKAPTASPAASRLG
eukprot:6614210-Pyramimonas_sp.AAC.1